MSNAFQVLLVSDNAEVKKMVAAVGETKVKVKLVGKVTSVKELVSAFKVCDLPLVANVYLKKMIRDT